VRSNLVVELPPVFDCNLRIDSILEPLHPEALVSELPVEALVRSVLPGLPGVDRRGLDPGLQEPLQHGARDELRSVVRSKMRGRAPHADELRKRLDHAP